MELTATGRPCKAKGKDTYNKQRRTRYAENDDVKDANKARCKARYEKTKVLKRDQKVSKTQSTDLLSVDTTTDKNHDE